MERESVDVLIVGFGAAGAAAALAAHERGARAQVLEKCEHGGGNCRHSGGFLFEVASPAAVDHLDALCFGKTDRAVLEAFAAGLAGVTGWLGTLGGTAPPVDPGAFGGTLPSWPHFPGAGHVSYRQFDGGDLRPGIALWHLLEHAVRERGIPVALGAPVSELLVEDGAVRGAVTRADGRPRAFEASGGVILACGGIEYDAELVDTYLPCRSCRSATRGTAGTASAWPSRPAPPCGT